MMLLFSCLKALKYKMICCIYVYSDTRYQLMKTLVDVHWSFHTVVQKTLATMPAPLWTLSARLFPQQHFSQSRVSVFMMRDCFKFYRFFVVEKLRVVSYLTCLLISQISLMQSADSMGPKIMKHVCFKLMNQKYSVRFLDLQTVVILISEESKV